MNKYLAAAIAMTATLLLLAMPVRTEVTYPDLAVETRNGKAKIERTSLWKAIWRWLAADSDEKRALAPSRGLTLDLSPAIRPLPNATSGVVAIQIPQSQVDALYARMNTAGEDNTFSFNIEGLASASAKRTRATIRHSAGVIKWTGLTEEGRTVQLSLVQDSVLFSMAAGQGVLSLEPSGLKEPNHILQRPLAYSRGGPTQSGKAVKKDCEEDQQPPPYKQRLRVGIAASEGVTAATTSQQQLMSTDGVLNIALASSGAHVSAVLQRLELPISVTEEAVADLVDRSYCARMVDEHLRRPILRGSNLYRALEEKRYSTTEDDRIDFAILVSDLRRRGTYQCAVDDKRPTTPLCGEAFSAVSDVAFYSVIHSDCKFDETIVAHEVGHLLGARHELYDDPTGDRANHANLIAVDRLDEVLHRESPCLVRKPGDSDSTARQKSCSTPSPPNSGTLCASSFVTEKLPRFASSLFGQRCGRRELVFQDSKANNALVVARNALLVSQGYYRDPEKRVVDPPGPHKSYPIACLAIPKPTSEPEACSAVTGFGNRILFHRGNDALKNGSAAGTVIAKAADAEAHRILVLGFASSVGHDPANIALSLKRATAVATRIDEVRRRKGMLPARTSICPYGEAFAKCFEDESSAMSANVVLLGGDK